MTRLYEFVRSIAQSLGLIGSARRASVALESGRTPARGDLMGLGYNPHAFTSMGHG